MSEDAFYLKDYPYVGITGTVYYPFFKNGKWWIIPRGYEYTIDRVGHLCNIPYDELTFLKLKYGG
jgi:hypothetical protein